MAQWCQQHRHDPVANQAAALNAKLRGHYQYYGRPANYRSLWRFYRLVRWLWHKWLTRRTRGQRLDWARSANCSRVIRCSTDPAVLDRLLESGEAFMHWQPQPWISP